MDTSVLRIPHCTDWEREQSSKPAAGFLPYPAEQLSPLVVSNGLATLVEGKSIRCGIRILEPFLTVNWEGTGAKTDSQTHL